MTPREPDERPPRQAGRLRRALPLLLTVVFLLVAVGVVVLNREGGGGGDDVSAAAPRTPCTTQTPLTVTSSSEKDALLRNLANRYNRIAGSCGLVTVDSMDSGRAADRLAGGWRAPDDGALRPDVWSPASSAWVGFARRSTAGGSTTIVPEAGSPLARTPLVFAVPESVATRLGLPRDATLSWADVVRFRQDSGGSFTFGKTNPTVSTSGLYALLSGLLAAPRAPAGAGVDTLVDDPAALAFEEEVEKGVVHYGNTEQEFLTNLAAVGGPGGSSSYVGAVAVEEKSVWDYNHGNPQGTVPRPTAPPPADPLRAIPLRGGTYVSDSPFLVLTAPWVDDAKRNAAEDFRRWLLEPCQQQDFRAAGFRADATPCDGAPPVDGVPDTPITALPQPDPDTVATARARWREELRKPADVTVVLDRSGSMLPSGNRKGEDRWTPAKDALGPALEQLGPRDRLSVWTFSSPRGGNPAPYDVAVPPGGADAVRPAVRPALDAVLPEGGTALYETAQAAVESARRSADPDRIQAVVLLTDGVNEDTTVLSPDALFGALSARPPVRVFSIAYSSESDLASLGDIARRSGGAVYNAQDTAAIRRVFEDVIANF